MMMSMPERFDRGQHSDRESLGDCLGGTIEPDALVQGAVAPDADRAAPRRPRVSFCSMPFDLVSATDVLDIVAARPADQPFVYVTTPNVDHVVRLGRNDPTLRPLYENAFLTVCDSRILAALSDVAGDNLPVTTGADLTDKLLRSSIASTDTVNIIGADADVVLRLRARFRLNHTNFFKAPMGLNRRPEEIERCVDFIERYPARYTFLAVGSPQQEKIALGALRRGTATGIGLCIGTALQFSAGVIPRAPRWVQKLHLEWLHRLAQEPRRLARRYLVDDIMIFPMFTRHLLAKLRPQRERTPGQ